MSVPLISGRRRRASEMPPVSSPAFLPIALVSGRRRRASGTPAPPILFTDQMAGFLATRGIFAYPNVLPSRDLAYPLVSFTVITGDNCLILSGASSLAWIMIQIDCYSPASFDAESMSETLRKTFQDFRGMLGLVKVASCNATAPRSGYTPAPTGSDVGVYRASRDFKFRFYR